MEEETTGNGAGKNQVCCAVPDDSAILQRKKKITCTSTALVVQGYAALDGVCTMHCAQCSVLYIAATLSPDPTGVWDGAVETVDVEAPSTDRVHRNRSGLLLYCKY